MSDNGPRVVTFCPAATDEVLTAACGNDNTEETAANENFSQTLALIHILRLHGLPKCSYQCCFHVTWEKQDLLRCFRCKYVCLHDVRLPPATPGQPVHLGKDVGMPF